MAKKAKSFADAAPAAPAAPGSRATVLRRALPAVLWILLAFATRLPALSALPLHNDEGLHLTRAIEVWNAHPFWQIGDGKIINHWAIAVFMPQNAPVFAGRIATVLVGLIGVSAGLAFGRRLGGAAGMTLAAALLIFSPYLFFYDRLAFSDAEAGALAAAACLGALVTARSGRLRDALLAGALFAAAVLFKFTAAPFALALAVIVLALSHAPLRRRLLLLAAMAGVLALSFIPPTLYLLLRGQPLFDIALGWIGGGGTGTGPGGNLARFATLMSQTGIALWALVAGAGLALLLLRGRQGAVLLCAALLPFAVTVVLGREVLPRHFAASLPLALALAGAGWGALLAERGRAGAIVATGMAAALALAFAPFALTAYTRPADLPLPQEMRMEHLTTHSAGTGLREAVRDLPAQGVLPGQPVIASMFPDSCRRANFEAPTGYAMQCTDAPGADRIREALDASGLAFVVTDTSPMIGADIPALAQALGAQAQRLAGYPRPDESETNASVVLWVLRH